MNKSKPYLTIGTAFTLLVLGLTPCSAADAPQAPADDTVIEEPAPALDSPAEDAIQAQPADVVTTDTDAGTQPEPEAPTTPSDPMDRSDWPAIVVTPADGKVTHNPHFVGGVPMGEDIVSPLHAPDPVWQIQEALRGEEAGNLNDENLADLGAQPFIALGQFIAMPFRMIVENPWSKETSPK